VEQKNNVVKMDEDSLPLLATSIIRMNAVISEDENEDGKTVSIFKIKRNRP
jgi:hypothetical protein